MDIVINVGRTKLWHSYLTQRVKMMQAKGRHPSNPPSMGIQENGLRSLVHVHVTLDVMITYLLLMVQHDMPWWLSNVTWFSVTCNMLTWFLYVDGEV
jgi:hypothetical protein